MDAHAHLKRNTQISRAVIARHLDLDLDKVDDLSGDVEPLTRVILDQFEELVEAFENDGDNDEKRTRMDATNKTPKKWAPGKKGHNRGAHHCDNGGDNSRHNRSEADS